MSLILSKIVILLLLIVVAVVVAESDDISSSSMRDTTYYIHPNFYNPLLKDSHYYNDAMNLFSDLTAFSNIYIQYSNCAMIPSSTSNNGNDQQQNGADNDYWYMGATPIVDAQITFSLYGTLKHENNKNSNNDGGCHRSTFINSFYTTNGITSFVQALTTSGLSDINTDGSSSNSMYPCHVSNNVGYGLTCSSSNKKNGKNNFHYNQYSVVTSSNTGNTNAICTPDQYQSTIDTLDTMNSVLQGDTMQCYEIYNSNSIDSTSIAMILSNARTCSTMYDPLVQRNCPDPYHVIQHREQKLLQSIIQYNKSTQQITQDRIIHTSIVLYSIAGGIFVIITIFLLYQKVQQRLLYWKQQRRTKKQSRSSPLKVHRSNFFRNRTNVMNDENIDDNDKNYNIPEKDEDDTMCSIGTDSTTGCHNSNVIEVPTCNDDSFMENKCDEIITDNNNKTDTEYRIIKEDEIHNNSVEKSVQNESNDASIILPEQAISKPLLNATCNESNDHSLLKSKKAKSPFFIMKLWGKKRRQLTELRKKKNIPSINVDKAMSYIPPSQKVDPSPEQPTIECRRPYSVIDLLTNNNVTENGHSTQIQETTTRTLDDVQMGSDTKTNTTNDILNVQHQV